MLKWIPTLCLVAVWLSLIRAEAVPRIVAMGDLHGDLDNTLSILRFSGIVNEDGHWAGGDTILVQTGDIVDRGVDTIALYQLIQRLRVEAQAVGGRVVNTLGNHEIMNMVGDWRYVHPNDIESFGGVAARKQAFSVEGWIGSDLILWNLTAKVGSSVFCHGGIHPAFANGGIEGINTRTRETLDGYVESHRDPYSLYGGHGPTWYRGYALDDEDVCAVLDKALEQLDADRMVMGHTVQRDGKIRTRCGGKAVLIDIGISHVYGGHAGALEIVGEDLYAIYKDRKEKLPQTKRVSPHLYRQEL